MVVLTIEHTMQARRLREEDIGGGFRGSDVIREREGVEIRLRATCSLKDSVQVVARGEATFTWRRKSPFSLTTLAILLTRLASSFHLVSTIISDFETTFSRKVW